MKAKINKLLCSNKFTFLISLIFSFCIWIKLSTSSSERISKTITNIPIVVNLSESAKEAGLTIFGLDNIKAEVTVSGNRITLGQLTKDNITVFAQQSAGIINSTGNYTLELCAKKNGRITNYEILDNVSSKTKIKEVRKEALSFGLMKLYQEKDVDTINLLGECIDNKIIESDEDISAIIDWAKYK